MSYLGSGWGDLMPGNEHRFLRGVSSRLYFMTWTLSTDLGGGLSRWILPEYPRWNKLCILVQALLKLVTAGLKCQLRSHTKNGQTPLFKYA